MKIGTRLLFSYFVVIWLLVGCVQPSVPPPMCRIQQGLEESTSANAGCLIKLDNKLLVIMHRPSGRWDIPGGTADSGETAQCTAHRETFEETGLNVEVGQFLGSNDHHFRFYACSVDSGFTGEITEFPVPEWAEVEVSEIQLLAPEGIKSEDWRFPQQWQQVKAFFSAIPASQNSDSVTKQPSEQTDETD